MTTIELIEELDIDIHIFTEYVKFKYENKGFLNNLNNIDLFNCIKKYTVFSELKSLDSDDDYEFIEEKEKEIEIEN